MLGRIRLAERRAPVGREPPVDSEPGGALSRWRGWAGFIDGAAHGDCGADGAGGVVENPGARVALFCPGPFSSSWFVWHLYRVEFRSLVSVLGTEPDPGIFSDQILGRADALGGGNAVFCVHHGW